MIQKIKRLFVNQPEPSRDAANVNSVNNEGYTDTAVKKEPFSSSTSEISSNVFVAPDSASIEDDLKPAELERLVRLQELIQNPINPKERNLFLRALRHRSLVDVKNYRSHESYERLEFLGDAVLELIVSEMLYRMYPQENEGFLTKLRAKIVRGKTLAELAEKLKLYELAEFSDSLSSRQQKRIHSTSILADLFESLVAALYLAKGFETTHIFVRTAVEKHLDIENISKRVDNYKSLLMEHLQANQRNLPDYKVMKESGPDHQKVFTIGVYVDDVLMGQASGKSKKEAEQRAASQALNQLKGDTDR